MQNTLKMIKGSYSALIHSHARTWFVKMKMGQFVYQYSWSPSLILVSWCTGYSGKMSSQIQLCYCSPCQAITRASEVARVQETHDAQAVKLSLLAVAYQVIIALTFSSLCYWQGRGKGCGGAIGTMTASYHLDLASCWPEQLKARNKPHMGLTFYLFFYISSKFPVRRSVIF